MRRRGLATTLATVLGVLATATATRALAPDPPLVVVDPGHGGSASGMVAPGGLRESDLNLAVARELGDALRRAGLRVVMTRVGDTDVRIQAPFVLRDDLAARAQLAGALDADLFVSCHHNATGAPADEGWTLSHNRTEVYYRVGDEAASRAAGAAVVASLAPLVEGGPKLGPHARHRAAARLLPGGFAVLRENARPALLGEPLYLSARITEAYARDPRWAQLEARFYARGIQDYLAHAPAAPNIVRPAPGEILGDALAPLTVDWTGSVQDTLVVTLGPREWRLGDVAPGNAARTTAAKSQAGVAGVGSIATRGSRPVARSTRHGLDLGGVPAGDATLVARVLTPDGRVSASTSVPVRIAPPPRSLSVVTFPDPLVRGLPAVVSVTVRDARGLEVADGSAVSFASAEALPQSIVTTGGSACALLERAGESLCVCAGGECVQLTATSDRPGLAWRTLRVMDARSGAPVRSAVRVQAATRETPASAPGGAPGNAPGSAQTSAAAMAAPRGEVLVMGSLGEARVLVNADGYETGGPRNTLLGRHLPPEEIRLMPVLAGTLIGRAIVLDIPDPALRTALAVLGARLEHAGAHVRVTAGVADTASLDETERIRRTNDGPIDCGVALLGHTLAGPVSIHYHPGSAPGLSIARTIARGLSGQVKGLGVRAGAEGTYWLNNTRGTTVEVVLAGHSPAIGADVLAGVLAAAAAAGLGANAGAGGGH